jgi:hypothetical protein
VGFPPGLASGTPGAEVYSRSMSEGSAGAKPTVQSIMARVDTLLLRMVETEVATLLPEVRAVVHLFPLEISREVEHSVDTPTAEAASKLSLLRYLDKVRNAVSIYCTQQGISARPCGVDPTNHSFVNPEFRRIFLETQSIAYARYKDALPDEIIRTMDDDELQHGFSKQFFHPMLKEATTRFGESQETFLDVATADSLRNTARALLAGLDPTDPRAEQCFAFWTRLPPSLRYQVELAGASQAHVLQCARFLHDVLLRTEDRCGKTTTSFTTEELIPTTRTSLLNPLFVCALEQRHRVQVDHMWESFPDPIRRCLDRQRWEAYHTTTTYAQVHAFVLETFLQAPVLPPVCPWPPIYADEFFQQAGAMLGSIPADDVVPLPFEELVALLPDSIRTAASPVPVEATTHVVEILHWFQRVMGEASAFCAEHQIQAAVQSFRWKGHDDVVFQRFRTHHATMLADTLSHTPDRMFARLTRDEFARDWTLKNLDRLLQDVVSPASAGAPTLSGASLRPAFLPRKRLRVTMGGASSPVAPVGLPVGSLIYPAVEATVEQLTDPGTRAGEYQMVVGRITRTSEFHTQRLPGKPKMCFVLGGAVGSLIRVVVFQVGSANRGLIKMGNIVRLNNVQRQSSYPPHVGVELLFNDLGKSGRRPSTLEVLQDDPRFPSPGIHLRTFADMRGDPLGAVTQFEDFRAKVVGVSARQFVTTSRRQLTLQDELHEQRAITVWENYAAREWSADHSVGKTFLFLGVERGFRRSSSSTHASSSNLFPSPELLNAWYDAVILPCLGELAGFALP